MSKVIMSRVWQSISLRLPLRKVFYKAILSGIVFTPFRITQFMLLPPGGRILLSIMSTVPAWLSLEVCPSNMRARLLHILSRSFAINLILFPIPSMTRLQNHPMNLQLNMGFTYLPWFYRFYYWSCWPHQAGTLVEHNE